MFESILATIVSKVIAHMFEKNVLNDKNFISIENAPAWYMQEKDIDKYYIFRYSKGTIASIDKEKIILKSKMRSKIKQDINNVINHDKNLEFYKEYQDTVVQYVSKIDIKSFVDTKIQIPYIEYKAAEQEVWLGGYITRYDFSCFLNNNLEYYQLNHVLRKRYIFHNH